MCRSSLFERAGTAKQRPADDEEGRQLSAKLHSFFGFPPSGAGTKDLATHPYARSRVYDLRNYTDQNEWGPFRKDGSMRVDWEMVESIMIVVGHNSFFGAHNVPNPLRPPWFHPLDGVIPDVPVDAGQAMPDYMALLKQPDLPLDMKDPYRVQGIWSRVCYLPCSSVISTNGCRLFAFWTTLTSIITTLIARRGGCLPTSQERHLSLKKPLVTSS